MAKVFITGSSQGLGLMAAQRLAGQGHGVVLHARDAARAQAARRALPEASGVVVGDVSTLAAMRDLAEQANALGRFDAVIHNVAIGYREKRRIETEDGLSQLWAVNVLAPYVLTASMHQPGRLVYISSELHRRGSAGLADLQWIKRHWDGTRAYSDTKLHDVWLALGVARRWPDVLSNAIEPGWVATRMGGPRASGDLAKGSVTQAWLATSDDPAAKVSGGYFHHQQRARLHPDAASEDAQDRLFDICAKLSAVQLG